MTLTAIGGALLIFLMRLFDVSLGTLRMIMTVRGKRFVAAAMGFVEAVVFITAVASVLGQVTGEDRNWFMVAGYAAGFAAGTALGISIERWLAMGLVVVRVIVREDAKPMLAALADANFGYTRVTGDGREGDVGIVFVVVRRRRIDQALQIISDAQPNAFVTVDPVSRAIGGFMPSVAAAAPHHGGLASMRK